MAGAGLGGLQVDALRVVDVTLGVRFALLATTEFGDLRRRSADVAGHNQERVVGTLPGVGVSDNVHRVRADEARRAEPNNMFMPPRVKPLRRHTTRRQTKGHHCKLHTRQGLENEYNIKGMTTEQKNAKRNTYTTYAAMQSKPKPNAPVAVGGVSGVSRENNTIGLLLAQEGAVVPHDLPDELRHIHGV